MLIESRVTWEKLAIELDLLSRNEGPSVISLLFGLNSWLQSQEAVEPQIRQLNFMVYELIAKSEGLSEVERFNLLNQFFFIDRNFSILPLKASELQEHHFLIKNILETRSGAPISMVLLYLHFAQKLDLPINLMQIRHHYILKWERGSFSNYIDFLNDGQILNDERMMSIIHRINNDHQPQNDPLKPVSCKKLFIHYLNELITSYEIQNSYTQALRIYNVHLQVDPQNSRLLGRRALIHLKLGYTKEALSDLKRYFAFVDKTQAPSHLVAAYQELTGSKTSLRSELLH